MDFGGFDTELMTIRKKEGQLYRRVWEFEKGGGFDNPIAMHNGIVFVGSNDYFMYGIDPQTGEKVWEFGTDGCIVNVMAAFYDEVIYFGSYDQHIYAVDIATRNVIWKFKTGGKVTSGCTISEGVVFCGSRDAYMYALDAKTGAVIWRFKAGDIINSKPTVHGNMLLFGCYDANLYCLDKNTGTEIWRFKTEGNITHLEELLIIDDVIYAGSQDGNIYAITIGGNELWRFRAGGGFATVASVLDENTIVIGCRDANMYAIDRRSGAEVWRFQGERLDDGYTSGFAASRPIVTENAIFIGSSAHRIYAIDHDGNELWSFVTDGPVWVSGVYIDGKVIFDSEDCRVYGLNATNGEEIWRFHSRLSTQKKAEVEDFSPVEVEISKGAESYEAEMETERYEVNMTGDMLDSEYSGQSEYIAKSEYAGGSDYK